MATRKGWVTVLATDEPNNQITSWTIQTLDLLGAILTLSLSLTLCLLTPNLKESYSCWSTTSRMRFPGKDWKIITPSFSTSGCPFRSGQFLVWPYFTHPKISLELQAFAQPDNQITKWTRSTRWMRSTSIQIPRVQNNWIYWTLNNVPLASCWSLP